MMSYKKGAGQHVLLLAFIASKGLLLLLLLQG
jgi:hypothetical protein